MAIYVVLNATNSRIMYLIMILTIEINNDNNKNDIVWLILSLFFFSQSQRCADRHEEKKS
jgi:hypothetical protein